MHHLFMIRETGEEFMADVALFLIEISCFGVGHLDFVGVLVSRDLCQGVGCEFRYIRPETGMSDLELQASRTARKGPDNKGDSHGSCGEFKVRNKEVSVICFQARTNNIIINDSYAYFQNKADPKTIQNFP